MRLAFALAAGLAIAGPAAAVKHGPQVPPPPRVAAITWPGPAGGVLHGMMAIPAKARGRQPAVLVLGEGTGESGTARRLAERLAAAGLLACALDGHGTATAIADARATVAWLATNRYATGKVGAVGFGDGLKVAEAMAREPHVAAVLLIGAAATTAPPPGIATGNADPSILAETAVPSPDFTAAAAFLRAHLR